MRSPTPRQIPVVVLIRVATTISTRAGAEQSFRNTLRRASIQEMNAAERTVNGLVGSTRGVKLLFGPPAPGVRAEDLIFVPPVVTQDPLSPIEGDIWVNKIEGVVKIKGTTDVAVLATVVGLYVEPVDVVGPQLEDFGLCDVLVVLGPDEDSTRLGIQYRVDAVEQD